MVGKDTHSLKKSQQGSSVEVFTPTLSTINLMFGNVNLNNLMVEMAHCTIHVDDVFGCGGYSTAPIVVLTKTNILIEGIMEFVSNCTFDKTYVSCNKEPMALTLVMTTMFVGCS